MVCPSCHKSEAETHPRLGIIPCARCRGRQAKLPKPGSQIEFTSDHVRQQRRQFQDDIEQPHYKGHLNKKWLDIYGAAEAKNRGFTDEEIRSAQYVYDGAGLRYYNDKT